MAARRGGAFGGGRGGKEGGSSGGGVGGSDGGMVDAAAEDSSEGIVPFSRTETSKASFTERGFTPLKGSGLGLGLGLGLESSDDL